jgi:hypothetical protein
MARTSNKTVNDIKLPKYLKLNKGTMWFDTLGANCSNIRLSNTTTKFVGRGFVSDEEHENFMATGQSEIHEIARDENNNESSEHGAYGKVTIEDNSYFEPATVEKSKRANIINAYKNGILIDYDPENPPVEVKRNVRKNFSFKKGSNNGTDGDIIFTGTNKRMYDKLNNSKHEDLIKFITAAPLSARNNLMDLYDYELSGYNRLNRPRASVLDAVKAKLNTLGPGMSSITVEEFDGKD